MGTVSDLSLKSIDIQRPGGIMCDHLLILIFLNFAGFMVPWQGRYVYINTKIFKGLNEISARQNLKWTNYYTLILCYDVIEF